MKIKKNAITKLWVKSYNINTYSGISSSSGFPNFKLAELKKKLSKKYIPNENNRSLMGNVGRLFTLHINIISR